MGKVANVELDDELRIGDVLRPPTERDRERDERLDLLEEMLEDEPQSVRFLADATGIPKSTVQDLMPRLAREGRAARVKGGGWTCPDVQLPKELGRSDTLDEEECPDVQLPIGPGPSDTPEEELP